MNRATRRIGTGFEQLEQRLSTAALVPPEVIVAPMNQSIAVLATEIQVATNATAVDAVFDGPLEWLTQ